MSATDSDLKQTVPLMAVGSSALVLPLWPRPWRKWNGNYQKIFYDIQTTWGKTHIGCWPNAGKMNAADGTGRSWKPHQVAMIRRSIKEPPSRQNADVLAPAGEKTPTKPHDDC